MKAVKTELQRFHYSTRTSQRKGNQQRLMAQESTRLHIYRSHMGSFHIVLVEDVAQLYSSSVRSQEPTFIVILHQKQALCVTGLTGV